MSVTKTWKGLQFGFLLAYRMFSEKNKSWAIKQGLIDETMMVFALEFFQIEYFNRNLFQRILFSNHFI